MSLLGPIVYRIKDIQNVLGCTKGSERTNERPKQRRAVAEAWHLRPLVSLSPRNWCFQLIVCNTGRARARESVQLVLVLNVASTLLIPSNCIWQLFKSKALRMCVCENYTQICCCQINNFAFIFPNSICLDVFRFFWPDAHTHTHSQLH